MSRFFPRIRFALLAGLVIALTATSAVLIPTTSYAQELPDNEAECVAQRLKWEPADQSKGTPGKCQMPTDECNIESAPGLGIAICPVARMFAGMADSIYENIIQQLLVLPSLMENDALRIAWGSFLSIANVIFVIAFLFVIYSQITGMGISNYGIKKMLPKLVVGAIVINVSFYLCAVAVDLSNVAGVELYALLRNIAASTLPQGVDNRLWVPLITGILAGAGVIAIGAAAITVSSPLAIAALTFVLPALLAAVVALVVGFLVLAIRQGLSVILTILAPLAFAAAILPNTKGWFDKWWKLFQAVLIFFPFFAVAFGGAQIVGNIFITLSSAPENQSQNALIGLILLVFGLFIMVLPLFLAPFIWKYSGGMIAKIGSKLTSRGSGVTGFTQKRMGDIRKRKMNLAKENWQATRLKKANNIKIPNKGRVRRLFAKSRRWVGYQLGGMNERIDNERIRGSENAQDKSYADDITTNEGLAERAAGKYGDKDTAVAQAQQKLIEIELNEAEAQSVSIDRALLDTNALKSALDGNTVTGANGQKINGNDPATFRALMREALQRQDYEAVDKGWEQAQKGNLSMRRAAADEIGSSDKRASWYSQGALQAMREGKADDPAMLRAKAIENNTYSPEKLSTTPHGELALMAKAIGVHTKTAAAQQFRNNATQALTDPQLRRNVGRNLGDLETIRRPPPAGGPTPGP